MREVDLFGTVREDRAECWIGHGSPHGKGYTTIWRGGKNRYTHRVSYEHHKGPIPDGLVIDHLCRNRACYNPDHLEPVTNSENILRGESAPARNARKTGCPTCGSAYSIKSSGDRYCRPCRQRTRTDTKRIGIGRSGDRTQCPYGHEYTEENTYLVHRPDGTIRQRMCRECGRARCRARRAAAKKVR